ncbi:exomer complex subunit [Pichia kluyveri]|uniref:Exomer complex subunit n=1 Tax=Pichia kluyveri TaxID=36015 RepID=A0AAV5R805_PICKL|nr:exomer complex subunit [Pichia kluyveri]
MSMVTQMSIPEVLDREIEGAINDRTAVLSQINDLGPPDLVTLTKIIGTPTKSSTPQSLQTTNTYFYYTGVDTSSVATIAALLNSLNNIISEKPQMWFGKQKAFHVSHASYSTYNAFRRLDMRVHVAFPGSVSWKVTDGLENTADSSIINEEDANEMWEETFMSSMVRTLVTSNNDDEDFASIVELRRINPFLDSKYSIPLFLSAFKNLYTKGEYLGCNEDSQNPTRTNNYMVDAFFQMIELTQCYDEALDVLNELYATHPEIAPLVAKLLFVSNRELDAVKFIHKTLSSAKDVTEIPGSSNLLLLQSEYCLEKSRPDLALPLAIKSVETSPSLFAPWENLVKVYIALNKFEDALLTLNACPMVTHKDKYVLKRIAIGSAAKLKNDTNESIYTSQAPSPNDLHLPLPQDVFLSGVTDLSSQEVAAEHAQLLKSKNDTTSDALTPHKLMTLPASSLKSTFRKAYSLLSEIVHKIGWEGMLNHRAKVFVMEEEYSGNPSQEEVPQAHPSNEFRQKRLCERWLDNLFMLLYEDMKAYTYFRTQEMQAESMSDNIEVNNNNDNGYNKHSTLSDYLGLWGNNNIKKEESVHQINNGEGKMNLDPYTQTKTCLEWEMIGLVSERLGHIRDAQRCYERALARRFSVRSAKRLIGIYSRWRNHVRKQIGVLGKLNHNSNDRGLIGQSKWNASMISLHNNQSQANRTIKDPAKYDAALLRLIVGLLVWDYRWYSLFSPLLLSTLSDVVGDLGETKTISEVRVWFDESHGNRGVVDLVNVALQTLNRWGRIEMDL